MTEDRAVTEKKPANLFSLTLFALVTKGAKLIKLTKFFKVAKPMMVLLSMSISAIAYTFLLGPWLSILFVILLFVHEMGHVIAMQIKGFDTPKMVFIPFLGAAIFAPKNMDRHTEAFIGYGGPLLGTIGTLVVFAVWSYMPKDTPMSSVLLVGSFLGAQINIFNLIPISPLDGGRITQASGAWLKYVGFLALFAFSVVVKEPAILYVWIIVLADLTIISALLRAFIVCGCWIAMVVLMSLGYSDQPAWVSVFDCIVTLVFVIMSIGQALKVIEVEKDDRPNNLSFGWRMGWFALYIGLAIALVLIIKMQLPLLPQKT